MLNEWKNKLLDLSNRNNQINYRDTLISSIDVIYPGVDVVYNNLVIKNKKLEAYDIDSAIDRKVANQTFEQELSYAKKRLKRNQVLIFKKDLETKKVLKNLIKKSKESIVEKGINVLYMALGFINWCDVNDSKLCYKAPLVLVPIKITNKSSIEPFQIELYENDIITNPTLLYKVSNDHDVHLPEIEEDECILDYFKRIEEVLVKLKWKLDRDMKIAMFSFMKMNMYIDIKSNEEIIKQNANVKRIIGIKDDTKREEQDTHVSIDNVILNNVVDADSSQNNAIIMAKSGKSFVLQGPPGTGKSQTITNIIAECLADGKKVLFVSEKLAALSVVFNNLKRVGLDEFCLELHSHKTNKKVVIDELNRVLNNGKKGVNENADREVEELQRAKEELDLYNDTLHTRLPVVDLSPYQIYSKIVHLGNIDEVEYVIPDISSKGADYLMQARNILTEYMEYVNTIGYDFRNNEWYGFTYSDINYESKLNLNKNLAAFKSFVDKGVRIRDGIEKCSRVEINNLDSLYGFKQVLDTIYLIKHYCKDLYIKTDLARAIKTLNKVKEMSDNIIKLNNDIDKVFEPSIYEADINDLIVRYRKLYQSIFRVFNKKYKEDKIALKMHYVNPGKRVGYKKMLLLLEQIERRKALVHELKDYDYYSTRLIGDKYNSYNTDWDSVLNLLIKLYSFMDNGYDLLKLSIMSAEEYDFFYSKIQNISNDINELFNHNKECIAVIDTYYDKSLYNLHTSNIDEVAAKMQLCLNNIDMVENWIRFYKLLLSARELGIYDYLTLAIDNKVKISNYADMYSLVYFKQWKSHILSYNELLARFNRINHDNVLKLFREKDKLLFNISKARIISSISSIKPNIDMTTNGSDVAVLRREGDKKRKLMPVRVLLSRIPELTQVLKPCFLMSPLSVSTYLEADKLKFDVAIFDEASQIFAEDALGAIYRANQVIVVGDEQQMPPSNYFKATIVDEYDDDNNYEENVRDYESILEICNSKFYPLSLKWHYRSRIEDLILFSNKNYYNSRLVTFPSFKKSGKHYGIDFHHISDGIYDRTRRINKKEAEYVVQLMVEHFNSFPDRSLGIVAFSQSQQDAIDDEIVRFREKNSQYDKFFKDDLNEPIFVKNLETVQGDERDTIIFSVGYGRDIDGKFLHNFGPLNRMGGERRLNVAITRAKYNIQLVSSINSHDIELKRTKARGVELLKYYLEYAEKGYETLSNGNANTGVQAEQFEHDVYNFLSKQGYKVFREVGCSGYKIDIAVEHPDRDEYVIAVECDGPSYNSIRSTRDRDRLRQEVLERLGWRFYRIWSTDWFKNNRVERERLLDAVQKAVSNSECKESVKANDSNTNNTCYLTDGIPEQKHYYEQLKITKSLLKLDYSKILQLIVDMESPVSEEWIMRRTLEYFDRTKITSVVKEQFDEALKSLPGIRRKNGFLYCINQREYPLRLPKQGDSGRDIKYIAVEELASGLYDIISENLKVNKEGMYKKLTELLGYSKVGPAIYASLDKALNHLIASNLVQEEGDAYSIKE